MFNRSITAVWILSLSSRKAARLAREMYLDIRSWRRVDGSIETLATLSERGCVHVVMSNFAPELDRVLSGLGLANHIAMAFSSASVGFEKPHESFFKYVIGQFGEARAVWMIGDNIHADIRGAKQIGLKTIFVGPQTDESFRRLLKFPT